MLNTDCNSRCSEHINLDSNSWTAIKKEHCKCTLRFCSTVQWAKKIGNSDTLQCNTSHCVVLCQRVLSKNYGISTTAGGGVLGRGVLELKLHEVPTTDSSQVR